MSTARLVLLFFATACTSATSNGKAVAETARPRAVAAPERERSACQTLPLFELYRKHGALGQPTATRVTLSLPIDLHEADCGAPDCFGHDMRLTLELGDEAGRCAVHRADASAVPQNPCDYPTDESTSKPWRNSFAVTGHPDLSNPTLDRIELRDEARGHAVVILRNVYYFYENVTPTTELLPGLVNSEDPSCCGGYTSSRTREWSAE